MFAQISPSLSAGKAPSPNFDDKLRAADELVNRVLKAHQMPVVACSFGKHSMVVLHLVRRHVPTIKVVWNNTGVEYPDTYRFVQRIRKEWRLHLIDAKPDTSFWKVVEKNGFPIFPRNAQWNLQRASTECCRQLKKKPTMKALRSIGCDVYFTGLTQFESRLRMLSAKKYGKYFYSTKWHHWKCHPILDWPTEDIWEYHRRFNIPYNSLYDKDEVLMQGGIRTGCWCCPMAIKYGKLQHLRHYYPKLFDFLVVKKGLGEAMVDLRLERLRGTKSRTRDYVRNLVVKRAKDLGKVLKSQPCFFDKL